MSDDDVLPAQQPDSIVQPTAADASPPAAPPVQAATPAAATPAAASQPTGQTTPAPVVPASPIEVTVVIENRTARRIGIAHSHHPDERLIISPFGTRRLSLADFGGYDVKRWVDLNLITVRSEIQVKQQSQFGVLALGCSLWILVPGALLGLLIPALGGNSVFQIVLVASLALAIIGIVVGGTSRERMRAILAITLSGAARASIVLLMGVVGVGFPAVIVLAFGRGAEVVVDRSWINTITPDLFGHTAQYIFTVVASTMPALLYFLFNRQRLDTVRKSIYRQIVLLDPNIQTTADAEDMHGRTLDEVYGAKGAGYYLSSVGLPIVLCTLLIAVGWLLILLPIEPPPNMRLEQLYLLFIPRPTVFNFGFLGAYFFALNMCFRRYVRADLTPKTYNHIIVRVLITVTVIWVLGALPELSGGTAAEPSPVLLALAFLVGIVPETGITILQDFLRRTFKFVGPSLQEQDPLTNLEGINIYDMARLSEEGVENVENLAHHNLIELLIHTRIPASRLVDLVDQSVLYLHVRGILGNESALDYVRNYGIRTATDLEEVCARGDDAVLKLLDQAQGDQPVSRLKVIRDALRDDEWMTQLRHWRHATLLDQEVFDTPQEFFLPRR
jgi:hypothetical protein